MKPLRNLWPFAAMAAALVAAGCAGMMPMKGEKTYTFEITNELADELLAPVLVAPVEDDGKIFVDSYVSAEAEVQILTGDPGPLAASIGAGATVAHGTDGPPGVLLAPGKSLTFSVTTSAENVRVIAMVAPTQVPDNYVTTVVSLGGAHSGKLDRFDIGHDEGAKSISRVASGVVSISVSGM